MKITDRYQNHKDLPTKLPVFPLRGCILLPRSNLPLNIFEPRYLKMFDDALASHRLIAIVQPARLAQAANDDQEGDEPLNSESPKDRLAVLRTTGCVGRVSAFQEMDDGRVIVSLAGVSRCRIGTEVPSANAYRTFNVSYDNFSADLVPGNGEQLVPRDQLLTTLKQFLAARNLKADWASISRSESEPLVNSLSVMSPYGPEEKQALLEAESLKARAEMLIALAEMELAANGGGPSGTTLQ
jgi:uncharacterized protein